MLSFAAFYALMYWALQHVAAGVATIVLAIVPLAGLRGAVARHPALDALGDEPSVRLFPVAARSPGVWLANEPVRPGT